MNDNKFKDKLSEIAKWYIPIINEYSQAKKPAINSNHNLINSTLGPVIEELTTPPQPCDWCGKIVNQCVSYQRVIPRENDPNAKTIWIEHCQTCHTYRNVDGGLQKSCPKEVRTTWNPLRRSNFNANKINKK